MPSLAATVGLWAALGRAAAGSASLDSIRVDPATGFLRDGHGRARVFHGVNVVYKEGPWYPPSDKFDTENSLDGQTMDLLRTWGFNVVRLGVMWPGVEPERGQIDDEYLKEMVRLSSELAQRGVYTLVDLHQDVGSRRFCGEGFPEFYVDELASDPRSNFSRAPSFPKPLHIDLPVDSRTKVPDLEDCLQRNFATYYLTDRVGAMWNTLYTPGTAMNSGFLRYWTAVAGAFSGQPQVVGYELLNEPSGYCLAGCGGVPGAVVSNAVEGQRLTPLYQAAAKAIRAVDAHTPIWYEATVAPKVVDVFPEVPLGTEETQQGLAYHIYCEPGDGAGPIAAAECFAAQEIYTHMYYSFLQKHSGVAGFMTEFGAIGGNAKELKHMNRLLGFADMRFQSWAYWMLKRYKDFTTANAAESLYDEEGELEVEKLKVLSRTYAPAIAGEPEHMTFDPETGLFELSFRATISSAPTVVYLNEELHYADGFSCEVAPASCLVEHRAGPNYLELHLAEGAPCQGSSVSVRIAPRAAGAAPALVV